jgi:hypothetical protein
MAAESSLRTRPSCGTAAETEVWLDGVGTVGGSEAEAWTRATSWIRSGRGAAAKRSIYGDEQSLSDSMVNAMREAVCF